MPTIRSIAAIGAVAAAAAPAAALANTVSHAKLWQTKSGSVVCGIEIHAKNKPATHVLCGAIGVPKPKTGIGDPFAEISAHGKPRVVLRSQLSYVATTTKTLAKGTTWSALGVTCTVKTKTVTCKNKSGHGFTIGNGKYTHF